MHAVCSVCSQTGLAIFSKNARLPPKTSAESRSRDARLASRVEAGRDPPTGGGTRPACAGRSRNSLMGNSTNVPRTSGQILCRGAENRTRFSRSQSAYTTGVLRPDTVFDPTRVRCHCTTLRSISILNETKVSAHPKRSILSRCYSPTNI